MCAELTKKNVKEPLYPHSVPERRYQNIGVDLFTFDQQEYLHLVYYFSNSLG